MEKKILGFSFGYHDSSACLIKGEQIIAAVQEERFTRIKNDCSFPVNSIRYILNYGDISLSEIDAIVFYEDPAFKLSRQIKSILGFSFRLITNANKLVGSVSNSSYTRKDIVHLFIENHLIPIQSSELLIEKILFCKHHLSHAASAFYPSPFQDAAIICIDRVGEKTTTSIWHGKENTLVPLLKIDYPNSLGLLYSAFTFYCGFKVNSGEYKLMGLAPYGTPIYADLIKQKLITVYSDGSFRLNLKYFNFGKSGKIVSDKFCEIFSMPVRDSESKMDKFYMDIASSIQLVTEEIIFKLANHAKKLTQSSSLCLSGGVALNCVANGKLKKSNLFTNIWVQPASGDAGSSVGAAYAVLYSYFRKSRSFDSNLLIDKMENCYLGPSYTYSDVKSCLEGLRTVFTEHSKLEKTKLIAKAISEGKVVGWFNGRMEFGPRALGNRSILGDPRNPSMQQIINLKIKFREGFRPFAPCILEEHSHKYFVDGSINPYMLFVTELLPRHCDNKLDYQHPSKKSQIVANSSHVPSITHVDYSARVQTVSNRNNPDFYALINEFYQQTGCPMIINTSFNVRGEPIVCSPLDAFNCFVNTNMDILVVEDFVLRKEDQPLRYRGLQKSKLFIMD